MRRHAAAASAAAIVTILLAVACSDGTPVAPTHVPSVPAPRFNITNVGADIFEAYSADTTVACATWSGCRDLELGEYIDALYIVDMLYGTEDGECILAGSKLQFLLDSNRVNVGNQEYGGYRGEFYTPLPQQDNPYIILAPSQAGAIWENRTALIHEGFHAKGLYSTASDSSLRRQQNESIYEPQATLRANLCNR